MSDVDREKGMEPAAADKKKGRIQYQSPALIGLQ
jgi:hypothetical protein